MAQYELLEFLKHNKGKYYNAKQLSKHFGITANSMRTSISKLSKFDCIEIKKVFLKPTHYERRIKYKE